jgi:hypothetical protein
VPAAAKIELPKRRLIENGDGLDQEAGSKVHGESLFLGKHRLHAFLHLLDIFFMCGYPSEYKAPGGLADCRSTSISMSRMWTLFSTSIGGRR